MFGANEYLSIVDSRQLYAGILSTNKALLRKLIFTLAEFAGPYRKNDPLLLLRGLEKFERLAPPEEGFARKVFSNISRLRQGRKSWEAHRVVNHNLLMEKSSTNMPRRELSVLFILDLAASVLMIMRHKRLSNQEDDLHPLSNDTDYELLKPLDTKTKDPLIILDQLIMSIDCNIVDGGNPKPRDGAFSEAYDDDEDRCRQLTNHFYTYVIGVPKEYNKGFYRKIGRLFSAVIKMVDRNNLVFAQQVLNKQQSRSFDSSMTNEEKECILQRQEFPNHRTSIVTCIGYYDNVQDENIIRRIRDSITRKQCHMNRNAYKVSLQPDKCQKKKPFFMNPKNNSKLIIYIRDEDVITYLQEKDSEEDKCA